MLRFIFNFILFGIIFYLLSVFFPDAFATLVLWANKTFEFLKAVIFQIGAKINEWRGEPSGEGTPTHQAILYLLRLLRY